MPLVMDENHEHLLRLALKLEPDTELPTEVVEAYWDVERTARRMGFNLSQSELILVPLLVGRPTPANPVSFLDESSIQIGDRVLAKYRGKWRWGRWVKNDPDSKRVIVMLDEDNGEEQRKFQPTSVRHPSREELKLIGEA